MRCLSIIALALLSPSVACAQAVCDTGEDLFSQTCPLTSGEPPSCNAKGGPALSSSPVAVNVPGWPVGDPGPDGIPPVSFDAATARAIGAAGATAVRIELRLPAGMDWGFRGPDADCSAPAVRAYQRAVENAHAAGLQVLLLADSTFEGFPSDSSQAGSWVHDLATLVKQCFSGKTGDEAIADLEVWNEPNLEASWLSPKHLAFMLSSLYVNFSAHRPPIRIGVGGISSADGCASDHESGCGTAGKAYVAELFRQMERYPWYQDRGTFPLDWVGYHPYFDVFQRAAPCDATRVVASFYDTYAAYAPGSPPPLQITEFGWSATALKSRAAIAANVARFYGEIGPRACVESSYLYKWQTGIGDAAMGPLGEDFGLYDLDGNPTPALEAFKQAARTLSCGPSSSYALRFRPPSVSGGGDAMLTP